MPSSGREHTELSLDEATVLFRVGEFGELVRRTSGRAVFDEAVEHAMRVLLAHALVLTGDWVEADKRLPKNVDELPSILKSRAFIVRGLIAHATGALTAAHSILGSLFVSQTNRRTRVRSPGPRSTC